MVKRKFNVGRGSLWFDVLNGMFMVFLMLIMAYPLIHVVSLSISDPASIDAGKVAWLPVGFNLQGYEAIIQNDAIWNAYGYTVLYAVVGTFLTLLLTALMAYPLSIKDFGGKKAITIFLSITMFFGGGLIPTYLLIRDMKMLDTVWVMIIPGCVGAYNVFLYRTFFQGIPPELRESAFIDGAGEYRILFKIILPVSKPLLATFGLFSIVGHWNSWYNAMIYLNDELRWPLQMVLRRIVVNYTLSGNEQDFLKMLEQKTLGLTQVHPYNMQMAAIVVAMVPILCIYPFIQKYFTKGVFVGSIKG